MRAENSGGSITTNLRALGSERRWVLDNVKEYGSPWFQGGIDEVCIFNRALTAAEIKSLMQR